MVQLSPDTDTGCVIRECYGHAAGYRHDDPTIQGFSHTHFSGAGHSDLGDFLVMPAAGESVLLEPGDPKTPGSGYRSRFSHDTETAQPGYYGVTLADSGIRAEMTAGIRVGVHRYAFPAGAPAHLVARSAQRALQLSGQDALVVDPHPFRRDDHRHARDARLGAGPKTLLRDAPLRAADIPCLPQPRGEDRL